MDRPDSTPIFMVKKFKLYERLNAQFRMDAFNVFNHLSTRSARTTGRKWMHLTAKAETTQNYWPRRRHGLRQLQFALRFDF